MSGDLLTSPRRGCTRGRLYGSGRDSGPRAGVPETVRSSVRPEDRGEVGSGCYRTPVTLSDWVGGSERSRDRRDGRGEVDEEGVLETRFVQEFYPK